MSVFDGNVLVVTGASSGIGRALCLALSSQKPKLVLAAREKQALDDVAAACRERGAETLVVPTDVSVEASCRSLIEKAVERFGRIDVLVNNAGITMWSRFEDMKDLSLYERILRVNVLGSIFPTFYALPHLKKSKGRIVTVASVAGLTGVPTRTGYSASKHALFGFFDSLRIELAGTGVTVAMIAPDFVVSEIHRRAIGSDGKPLGESPMREAKIMTAEECARMIVRAMEKRQRLLITSLRGRVGRVVRLVAPGLIDAVARKAIRQGR